LQKATIMIKKLSPIFSLFIILLLQSCAVKEYNSISRPIEHSLWDTLVKKHVTEKGVVDYSGFQKDSTSLNKYLSQLASAHPNDKNWSRDEQLAYWINAYNAFTVKLMVDHHPVKSIKDIKNGIPFVNTVWDIKFIDIEDANYDLNNIEHGIIRANFNEPRIHFACNCASISCPRLRNEAFVAERLDEQLTDQTKYFLSNSIKNEITNSKAVKLSPLFNWYGGDFKKSAGTVVDFINKYSEIKLDRETDIDWLDYNWQANDKLPE